MTSPLPPLEAWANFYVTVERPSVQAKHNAERADSDNQAPTVERQSDVLVYGRRRGTVAGSISLHRASRS